MSDLPYRQGANAFVISGEKFLIVQKKNYEENQWDVPGGGLNDGETAEEGILRELEEELGTNKFKILGKSNVINRYEWPKINQEASYKKHVIRYGGQEKHQFLVEFVGKKEDIKPQEDEIKQIKWVAYDELEKFFIFEDQWENAKKTLGDLKLKGFLKLL